MVNKTSRYTIETKNFIVIIGWDAPLGYYHLGIWNNMDDLIWSNLDQEAAFPKDFDEYRTIIRQIVGIELLADVIERLKYDKEHNTGNFEKTYKIMK